MSYFAHLHSHTQYSLLDGTSKMDPLLKRTKELGMDALAITDHGNMFGIPHFVTSAKLNGVKPIIGSEFYLAKDRKSRSDKRIYHQLLLAKNKVGYKNLIKLSSLGYLEGFYYKPRIDKEILRRYKEGLIATTCCLSAQVPKTIIEEGEVAAEKVFLEWLEIFGDDYYIELQRHGIAEQDRCNEVLCRWAKKYGVKMIATNDVHYINQEDSEAQDILLCVQTGRNFSDPNRMRFDNDQFYLKSPKEMADLFSDIPQAITNTKEIVDKVAEYEITRPVLMPNFSIPSSFTSQQDYLKHLTLKGAKLLYEKLSDELMERINFELNVLGEMGFAGYFLITQDLIKAARGLGVIVGPGRGSVAGSVVAYCLGITEVDPIRYNLLFERFLNPQRVSMPDIDIDFDDRQTVIDYVTQKYGKKKVAQIITFGTMAAKSAIRDIARVLELPLPKADFLAKLIPNKPGTNLEKAFSLVPELKEIRKKDEGLEAKILKLATTLEGVCRHTSIHAAGVIIAPEDITNFIPVQLDRATDLLVTQYDGSVIEKVGMLKMDFLALKTLSIIKETLRTIEKQKNITINLVTLPLNDQKTFDLYQKGATQATFQFESEGMQNCLRNLGPTQLQDLVDINALYRPGPMQFIPKFIARKKGKEKVEYPHPLLKNLLGKTNGIMVYQEQIMQTAQLIAGYSLAQADILRRAMGKKKIKEMESQRSLFVEGAFKKNNIEKKKALEIFEMMESFAKYGFNLSHSVAYTLIAYRTAYLKAHYPTNYMASVLTHNNHDIEKLTPLLSECQKMGIKVEGPHLNESDTHFTPNSCGNIRFGLAAIKGIGESVVKNIIIERESNGNFKTIIDFIERMSSYKMTKTIVENMALAGALDCFKDYHRRQYIYKEDDNDRSFAESLMLYQQNVKKEKETQQLSIFGASNDLRYGKKPLAPLSPEYEIAEKLSYEKELLGYYLSGHPLDPFSSEIKQLSTTDTQSIFMCKNKAVKFCGAITQTSLHYTKKGAPYLRFTVEDYKGTVALSLFRKSFDSFSSLIKKGAIIYIEAKIALRYNQNDNWEIRITNILPVEELHSKKSKALQIFFPMSLLSSERKNKLSQTLSNYPGNCRVEIIFLDKEKNTTKVYHSQRYRVIPSKPLLQQIESIDLECNVLF